MSTRFLIGDDVTCDPQRLVDTRLLIQANSGGGKSWAVRRLLEQTHGHVQHLVVDPEGEFSTLRERFDYVLAAPRGGDTVAEPRSAALLAEKLLTLGVSAVLDIFELKHDQRIRFVRLFLEALIDAPKTLWHPALIVVDEAHLFCPENAKAESASAVIDLATRGRKRGFCAALATQRISKLAKDAAAECNNKLIGRTSLDVDMKRAGDELGFAKADALALRQLREGEFFAFGPAISSTVTKVRVGPVQTSHPKAGARLAFSAPPPTAKVKALLPQLADLPAEAEQRAQTVDELRREVSTLKRELAAAKQSQPPAEVRTVEVPILGPKDLIRIEKVLERLENMSRDARLTAEAYGACSDLAMTESKALREALARATAPARPVPPVAPRRSGPSPRPAPPPRRVDRDGDGAVSGAAQRILDALAELDALRLREPRRVQVALLAGYTNLRSKGFTNACGSLSSGGLIAYPSSDRVTLTAAGHTQARAATTPATDEDIHARVLALLPGVCQRLLSATIGAHPHAIDRSALAESCGYGNVRSKGFTNALGRLSGLGLVEYASPSEVRAADVLFIGQ